MDKGKAAARLIAPQIIVRRCSDLAMENAISKFCTELPVRGISSDSRQKYQTLRNSEMDSRRLDFNANHQFVPPQNEARIEIRRALARSPPQLECYSNQPSAGPY